MDAWIFHYATYPGEEENISNFLSVPYGWLCFIVFVVFCGFLLCSGGVSHIFYLCLLTFECANYLP